VEPESAGTPIRFLFYGPKDQNKRKKFSFNAQNGPTYAVCNVYFWRSTIVEPSDRKHQRQPWYAQQSRMSTTENLVVGHIGGRI